MSKSFEEKRQEAAARLGIEPEGIPRHVAIIMDGNGRWAMNRGLPRFEGHRQGGKTVEKIAMYCVRLGIEYLTLYSFSMQNWKRPQEEVEFLMYLYSEYLKKIRPTLMENNVKLVHLGQIERLPKNVTDALSETVSLTGNNTGMVLAIALNYGSRTEIVDGIRRIAEDVKADSLDIEDIDQDCVSGRLYTAGMRDPDLLIRTSGEMRISNFLLWQISYTEFFVTDTHWPDFSEENMDESIKAYSARSRRFGDVKSSRSD